MCPRAHFMPEESGSNLRWIFLFQRNYVSGLFLQLGHYQNRGITPGSKLIRLWPKLLRERTISFSRLYFISRTIPEGIRR